ncbi:hypothetical protein SPBR_01838 [Sporothrix brasiliensis 5110]|uniref:HPP transmembrane region domain-containing protein n=1 Tax=Sporothrix brasiliensis 5110 TaxID=1398154 RepID=A0A0C2EX10_9PEZI|nr:uncharacterized protein SPBR_01838 [Sporothrix brasiliensis 5110]KIH91114.1 hypothetical protein SPBR_01838 [Sporothrix brasiliensis 5110]
MHKRSSFFTAAAWQFNIDDYVNRFIPPSVVPHLPRPLGHFLGYRQPPQTPHPGRIGNLIVIAWAFVGVFCGVSVVNVVDARVSAFFGVDGATITIGSFGAAAVLEFYAIESPLAQPRNAVVGQLLSSVIGVAVARLFSLLPPARFEALRWLAGSIACAAATAVMALTGTVHPPAGATALIAVADNNAYHIGWRLIPAVLLGSVLMQAIALLINNVQRRYPIYWWAPEEVGQFWTRHSTTSALSASPASSTASNASQHDKPAIGRTDKSARGATGPGKPEHTDDAENPENPRRTAPQDDTDVELGMTDVADPGMGHVTFTRTHSRSNNGPRTTTVATSHEHARVVITRNRVVVPDFMNLRPEERLVLETLSERL